jgi:hypothetical protein
LRGNRGKQFKGLKEIAAPYLDKALTGRLHWPREDDGSCRIPVQMISGND